MPLGGSLSFRSGPGSHGGNGASPYLLRAASALEDAGDTAGLREIKVIGNLCKRCCIPSVSRNNKKDCYREHQLPAPGHSPLPTCRCVCFVCWKCRLEIRIKLGDIDKSKTGWWAMLFESYVVSYPTKRSQRHCSSVKPTGKPQ